jgi:hypothetical protein
MWWMVNMNPRRRRCMMVGMNRRRRISMRMRMGINCMRNGIRRVYDHYLIARHMSSSVYHHWRLVTFPTHSSIA